MSTPPDMINCEPCQLAEYLLSNRFGNSAKATATFLLEATSTLPNAEALSAEFVHGENDGSEGDEATNLGESLSDRSEISMIQPRGKLICNLFEEGIHCVNAKNESFIIRPHQAGTLVVFPKPEDAKKKGTRDMVLLTLNENVMFKNKGLSQICFQLPNEWSFLDNFRSALTLTDMARVGDGGWNFMSHNESTTSTTTGGLPCVRCYHGVNDGHIFPLVEGILFFKPPLFLHRSSLHSIACGRGASGSSRYVDLHIQLEDQTNVEFTNIHREELTVLNDYLHNVLIPAMKQDADGNEDDDGLVVDAEAVDDDEATDDDVVDDDDDHDDDDDDSGPARRSRRKASVEARHATKAQIRAGVGDDGDDDDDDDGDDNWASPKQGDESDEKDDSDDDEDDEDFGANDDDDDETEISNGDDDEGDEECDYENAARPTKRSRR